MELFVFVLYINVVPAVHMEPDVQVLNKTKFSLIDFNQKYKYTWNAEELNQNDYNETGKIKFSIENWVFQLHPITKVSRWLNRQDYPRLTYRQAFQVLDSDSENGKFSFKQTTKVLARSQFIISIIVVKKQTENLEILYTSTLLSFVPDIRFRGTEAIMTFCRMWNDNTREIVKPEILTSCPCSLESAKMNPNLITDFTCSATEPDCHENVNAYRCFLIKLNHRYVCMYMGDTSI